MMIYIYIYYDHPTVLSEDSSASEFLFSVLHIYLQYQNSTVHLCCRTGIKHEWERLNMCGAGESLELRESFMIFVDTFRKQFRS